MLVIDNIIVTEPVLQRQFVCNLSACKGACCVAGDQGAPLEQAELAVLDGLQEAVAPFLTQEGREALQQQGPWVEESGKQYTTLRADGGCAYVTFDEKGIAGCGIEKAWTAGKVDFRKPISCHLYPIRVQQLHEGEALNYNEWDICDPACQLGESLQVPVYQFLKEALTRKYGAEFYAILEAGAKQWLQGED